MSVHEHEEQEPGLAPDESPTPLWLPLLGAGLLLVGAIFYVASQGQIEGAPEPDAAGQVQGAQVQAAQVQAAQVQAAQVQAGRVPTPSPQDRRGPAIQAQAGGAEAAQQRLAPRMPRPKVVAEEE